MKVNKVLFHAVFLFCLGGAGHVYAKESPANVEKWVREKLRAGGKLGTTPSDKIAFLKNKLPKNISLDQMISVVHQMN